MFRIQRQFVTLLPPEQPYRIGGTCSEEKEPEADGLNQEDLQKLQEEAGQRLKDAKRKADQIISDGKRMADKLQQEAREKTEAERETILAQARVEAEKLREAARKEGYAAGEAEATKAVNQKADERKEKEKEQFQALMDSANEKRDEMIDELEDGIRNLVMEIVKKVIRVKLEESDEVFRRIVENTVAEFHASDDLTVRVCPGDYEAYFGSGWKPQGRKRDDGRVNLIQEEEFNPGDCRVESETAVIDCSIDKQLDVIEQVLYDM